MSITIKIENDNDPTLQLNLANRNFGVLWAALELRPAPAGKVWGCAMMAKVAAVQPRELAYEATIEGDEGNWISYGCTESQAKRYLSALETIATLATIREEKVVWS